MVARLRAQFASFPARPPANCAKVFGSRESESEEQTMETLMLTDQQALRIAELPEDYRVVGVDRSAPFVRKPTGQILRIQQNGKLTAATSEARHRLAASRGGETQPLPEAHAIVTPYT